MKPKGKRMRMLIEPADEKRLVRALYRCAATGDFVALRTRAFVLLLWDGAIRTSAALALNAEEVVRDSAARRITVLKHASQRPCEENRNRGRSFVLSARTQEALAAYLHVVRQDGWLPAERLKGPLFLSSVHRGRGQRLSVRSAIHCWEAFQTTEPAGSRIYQLEDVVYTGRLKFMKAAGVNIESLSSHTGLSRRWAAEYRQETQVSPEDVMAKLDSSRRASSARRNAHARAH